MQKIIYYFIFLIISNIIFSSPSCKIGENYCSKCNPVTKLCVKCEKDIFIPDKNGGCEYKKKCLNGFNHCNKCNEENDLCQTCEIGYYPDDIGGCSYSNNCEVSYKGKCLKCKDNYILIGQEKYISVERGYIYYADVHMEVNEGTQICKYLDSEDLKNCKKINGLLGFCEECEEGFFLNNGDKKCSTIENCNKSIYGKCKICNKGFYLDLKGNKCKKQNEFFENCKESFDSESYKCDICEDGYYFDENYKCVNINFCENGKNLGNGCENCILGYYLTEIEDSCTKEQNCYSGNKDTGICSKCIEGYYLDYQDGKCKSNKKDNEYKYCEEVDYDICNKCIYGYELGLDYKCSSSKFCAESENGICILCLDNYYLGLDNFCTDIEHCMYSDKYICNECEDDFYYDQSDKKCKLAEGNFTNCKYGLEKENYCVTCKDNFYLNISDYLCYSSKENNNFYKCEISDTNNIDCYKCIEGYYLSTKNKKCSKIKGCNILDDDNKCIECDENYCLDIKTGKCENSNEIIDEEKKFYFRCNKTNEEGNACEICNDRYVLNKIGLCIDNEHCIEENEDGSCKQCFNDENNSFCLNNIFGCVESFFDNCFLCNDILDFDNCNKCFEGYELDEFNRCIEID